MPENKEQATPRPWKVVGEHEIIDADGWRIAIAIGANGGEKVAQIVREHNAHADLVAACKEALPFIDGVAHDDDGDDERHPHCLSAEACSGRIRAALAKAGCQRAARQHQCSSLDQEDG